MQDSYTRIGLAVHSSLKFTRQCVATYQAGASNSTPLNWEFTQRVSQNASLGDCSRSPAPLPLDAVEVCAVLDRGAERFLVLVAQYRPPLDAIAIEFPAGLVDANESPAAAAVRELFEETGYVVQENEIRSVSRPIAYEPGLTDSCSLFIRVAIDGKKAENINPVQRLDAGEDIEVILLPFSHRGAALAEMEGIVRRREENGERVVVDAKLHCFLEALAFENE